jgi:WD40 repeat protein
VTGAGREAIGGISVVEVAIGYGGSPGKFRVEVVRSPAGEASSEVSLDVARQSLKATAGRDARLLDVATGHIIRTFTGHTDLVAGVAFKPDGTLLATASHDRTARLWEVATGRIIRTFTGHTGAVLGVAFSPDGALLATARVTSRSYCGFEISRCLIQ